MIICINGTPTSGKSTFCDFCIQYKPELVRSFSTVDFVKQIAKECGWNGTKDAHNRKFLADLKELLVQWDNVPYKDIIRKIDIEKSTAKFNNIDPDSLIIFIHVREQKEIEKFINAIGAKTLLIRRPLVDNNSQSNTSDADVFNMEYDYEIINDKSLDELKIQAEEFIDQIILQEG